MKADNMVKLIRYIKANGINLSKVESLEVELDTEDVEYPVCGTCESTVMLFNVRYKMWYCDVCRKYLD